MGATLDGIGRGQRDGFRGQIHAALVVLGRGGGRGRMAQVQHDMWVTNARGSVLSIITGGSKWVEIRIAANTLYQHLLLTAEKNSRAAWRVARTFPLWRSSPPRPASRPSAVDLSASNSCGREYSAIPRYARRLPRPRAGKDPDSETLMPGTPRKRSGVAGRPSARNPGAVELECSRYGGRQCIDPVETITAFAAAPRQNASSCLVNQKKSLAARPSRTRATWRNGSQLPLCTSSSSLEIVRKTLSEHEIAVIQTTAIDQASRMLNLTTLLAHSSGEWIASHWPVCAMAEVANPHRMGAALTYARRYALFTLVGIAGEDDLDAPDICMPAPATGSSSAGLPFPSQTQGNGKVRGAVKTPSPMVLPVDESAALRDRLLSEVAGLASQDSATTHFRDFCFERLRRRTPGPSLFSSMKITPAASRARRTAKSLAAVIEVSSSVSSARRTVATLRSECRARSSALQRRSARAALIWALVSGLAMLTRITAYAMFYIILDNTRQKPPGQQTSFSTAEKG